MVQSFEVNLPNMEVRKVEEVELEINGKTYRSLNVHFDDVDCNRLVFKDKNTEHVYNRGDIGTLTLIISTENTTKISKSGNPYITEKTTMLIHDFKKNIKK